MSETTFINSNYKYTNPVRYFTKYDPIFYQVDNIPLKQLMENCNFLKDQIEGLITKTSNELEVARENFTELKPYITGNDNIVRVKPGRFTARINDGYNLNSLQFLTQVLGFNYPEENIWESETVLGTRLATILDKFKTNLAENALNTNGLVERTFTFPMQTQDRESQFLLSSTPGTSITDDTLNPPYPNYLGKLWISNTRDNKRITFVYNNAIPNYGFMTVGMAEADFTRRWRGIARTALVSVEEELDIEIPAFDEEDFYYLDSNGTKVLLDANHRIDLVFIYSKAIDASSTTISKFVSNTPTTITKPVLGIVKGAGIGISLRTSTNNSNRVDSVNLTLEDGTPIMLANIGDESGENTGIGSIRGSFPSPDDLMNISPLILESLATDHFALIGQSVLPVAYVVVRKTATISSEGTSLIAVDDLIDIRPFFRTTELAYNERAGIAAATPQISLANPVASEGYVDAVIRQAYNDYTEKINQLSNSPTSNPDFPRLVGCGYVKGGMNFGVEATLANYLIRKHNLQGNSQARQYVVATYGYPEGTILPDYPDWDIAEWCSKGSFDLKGAYPNDYINFHLFGPGFNGEAKLPFGSFGDVNGTYRISKLGVDRIQGTQSNSDAGNSCIYFVRKRIQIDRSQIGWATDYHVDAQLWNCAPLSCRTHKDGNNISVAGNASVWIDKRQDEFTIFVSWVASDQYDQAISPGSTEPGNSNVRPDLARNEGERFAGFSVINRDIMEYPYAHRTVEGESAAGVATYPTVTFQIFGIPNGYQGFANNLNGTNPTMLLK